MPSALVAVTTAVSCNSSYWRSGCRSAAIHALSTCDLPRPPGLVEERLERAVEAQAHAPSLARQGLDPVGLGRAVRSSTPSTSDEPTPEPASSSWSRTSRSGSSTPPPASSSATWSSTPPSTTKAPAGHPDHQPENRTSEPTTVGPGVSDVPRHHSGALGGIRTANRLIRSLSAVVSGRLARFSSRSAEAIRQRWSCVSSALVAVRTACQSAALTQALRLPVVGREMRQRRSA